MLKDNWEQRGVKSNYFRSDLAIFRKKLFPRIKDYS